MISIKHVAAAMAASAPLVLSATALAGGEGKDAGNPHGTAPGQAVAEQHSQRPETKHADHGARSHGAGKPTKAPKAKPTKPAKPAPPRAAAPKAPATKAHGPAGKTTICHATGSATNPYVTITISDNALPAHSRHQDGRDLIPAPDAGCPAAPAAKAAPAKAERSHEKVTICHATGSDTNPFVKITIAQPAVAAHDRHQHDEDIIPAPAEGCPIASADVRTAAAFGVAPAAPAPRARVLPQGAVLGEVASSGPAADVLAETVRRESGDDVPAAAAAKSLPFTGLDLILVAAAGLGALLAGVALRRSVATRRSAA